MTVQARADNTLPPAAKESETPWHISADKITYDQKENIYIATGNVIIQKDDKTLNAGFIRFNNNTMDALAEGNVLLTVKEDRLSGDKIDINLRTGTGEIENGLIFVEEKHFIIKGDKIAKTGKDTYYINHGSFTTCDGQAPAWHITGQDLHLTLEDYATVKNATIWAKQIPVGYVPYLIFPVKVRRQTGLLPPQIGYSNRNGAEYLQPFFWAINRSSDATFYFDHIQYRGEKVGGEYRYALDLPSKGTLMLDSLNDKKVDDGTDNTSEKWGFSGDNALRPNSDRYWFRMKADQSMPHQFNAKLDLDIISDQDYLREFSNGYTGYEGTEKYFESEFGRDIDDKNDPVRENSLNISRNWTIYSFTTDATWYDNVIARRQHLTDPTLQELPDVRFNGLKQPVFNDFFYADLTSEATYFYRQDGQTGQRGDLFPRLYVPYHYKQYVAFEPSIGFRQTDWYVDRKDPLIQNTDYYQHRELYDIRTDLSTDVFKLFDFNGETIDKIKHTVIPKLEYEYIPEVNQTEIPQFDDLDNISPKSVVTLSIANFITSKDKIEETKDEKTFVKQPSSPYHELCRFLIEQPYDLNKNKESDPTPFDPLYARLDFSPKDYLTLGADAKWSHEEKKLVSHNIFSQFSDGRGDRVYIEHRYNQDMIQSVYVDCVCAITHSMSIYGDYERNLKDSIDITKTIGYLYHLQCWSLEFSYQQEENNEKIGFMIHLFGLGDINNAF